VSNKKLKTTGYAHNIHPSISYTTINDHIEESHLHLNHYPIQSFSTVYDGKEPEEMRTITFQRMLEQEGII
jgi:hypothetical protein